MKSRQKKILKLSDHFEVNRSGIRLRQTTLEECYMKTKMTTCKNESFPVSSVSLQLSSDSEIEELPPSNIRSERKENKLLNSPTDKASGKRKAELPFPAKRTRTTHNVDKPSTSTPLRTSNNENFNTSHILNVECSSSVSSATQISNIVSPSNVNPDSCNKTILYNYTEHTFDEPTIPNKPSDTSESQAKSTDPNNFNEDTQNALESSPKTVHQKEIISKQPINNPIAHEGNQPSINIRKESPADRRGNSTNGKTDNAPYQASSSNTINYRTVVPTNPNQSVTVSVSPNGSNGTIKRITKKELENGPSLSGNTRDIERTQKRLKQQKLKIQKQRTTPSFTTSTPNTVKKDIKIVEDGQSPCCSKSLEPVNLQTVTKLKPSSSKSTRDISEKSTGKETTTPTNQKESVNKNGQHSPSSSQKMKTLKSKEGKQLQLRQLTELVHLFTSVQRKKCLWNLLSKDDHYILKRFLNVETNVKYIMMKLVIWKRTWYNVSEFCKKAQLEITEESDIMRIFESLKKEHFVDTDYVSTAPMIEMLHSLNKRQLKDVVNRLNIKLANAQNGQNSSSCTKEEMIQRIINVSNTQLTLTKTFQHQVMVQIEKKFGYAIQIKDEVYNAFMNAYLLATFTNPALDNIQEYFYQIIHSKVTFPNAPLDEFMVFRTTQDFLSYKNALQVNKKLEEVCRIKDKFSTVYVLGKEAYEWLLNYWRLPSNNSFVDNKEVQHLKRFTAEHIYCSVLSICCENVFTKQNGRPSEVKEWLEFLIAKYPQSRWLGKWYNRLIKLHMMHMEPINYNKAGQLLFEALKTKGKYLGEIACFELASLAKKFHSKGWQIDQIYRDQATELQLNMMNIKNFPQRQIDSQCIRSDASGKKRVYVTKNDDNVIYSDVESVALEYYAENGYPEGKHCEGSFIKALFLLYFWDIIYNPEKIVPGTFISKLQSAPLDMFTINFYQNRKDIIADRLREISNKWTEERLIQFGVDNWQNHSHEMTAFGMIMDHIKDKTLIEVLVTVIGRKVLAKIFVRLVFDIKLYSSGMPDLLVWDRQKKIHKFVEVKGEGDQLRPNQILWLNYLKQNGASIEVCWVHSAGSKRKKLMKT